MNKDNSMYQTLVYIYNLLYHKSQYLDIPENLLKSLKTLYHVLW